MADNGSQPMPSLLRSWARDAYTVGSARLRLSVPAWRRNLIRRVVESFAPNRAPGASFERSGQRRLAAFADLDRRFNWLDRVAASRNVSIVHVPRDIFRPVFHVLLQRNGYKPDAALGENSMSRYYDPALTGHRERYRRYCAEVGRDLVRLYGIEGVLLPKLNDDWIIDVLMGLRRAGLPVVVQDREHGITPKRLEVYPPHFRAILDDLACERLLVSNDIQRDFFRRAGYPAEFLVVTGKPDSDFWSYAPPPPQRRQIDPRLDDTRSLLLFFAFGRFNYLNFFYAGETRDWTPLGRDVHSVLLETLRRHKGRLQIVYKIGGKRVRDNFPGAELFLEEAAAIDPEGVVVLDERTSTLDLLRVSDGVLGFHTLGLVEAMFTAQPILYGAWGELFDDIKGTLMPFHQSDGLIWCDSPTRLAELLDRMVESPAALAPTPHQAAARRQFRETWYHKPDGRTAERVLDATLEAFDDFRRRRPCHHNS
jgi:hypothetical protein